MLAACLVKAMLLQLMRKKCSKDKEGKDQRIVHTAKSIIRRAGWHFRESRSKLHTRLQGGSRASAGGVGGFLRGKRRPQLLRLNLIRIHSSHLFSSAPFSLHDSQSIHENTKSASLPCRWSSTQNSKILSKHARIYICFPLLWVYASLHERLILG